MGAIAFGARVFVGAAQALPPDVKPEAEAKGTKAPIELTLRLFQKKIKVDESLWGQIELKNVGKSDIIVIDDIFFKPGPFPDPLDVKTPIYVEVTDAEGKPVHPRHWAPIARKTVWSKLSDTDPAEDKKVGDLIADWRKAGLSKDQIDGKLLEYSRDRGSERKMTERAKRNSAIKPGSSIKTPRWAHPEHGLDSDGPGMLPVGQFSELGYWFDKPGKYRIRAVYDYRMSERLKKIMTPRKTNILVKTPQIVFEVIP